MRNRTNGSSKNSADGSVMFKTEMNSEIYENVKDLACDLVNASGVGDTVEHWRLYQELEKICTVNEGSIRDHPFQWETLADFTNDDSASILIYEKAFELAKKSDLSEYMASIKLAQAERYSSIGISDLAYSVAKEANEYAKTGNDLELRKEISEFLLSESTKT